MKNTKFPTIMALMLLLLTGLVSAGYDISIVSVQEDASSPFFTDIQGIADILIENVGDASYPGASDVIEIIYDDGTSETKNVPPLAIGQQLQLIGQHTYTNANTYTISVNFTPGGDDDATNDVDTLNLNVLDVINDISIVSVTSTPNNPIENIDMVTFEVTIENTGNQYYAGATNGLSFDYDDSSADETSDVPALAVGESDVITLTHTYASSGNYNTFASFTAGDDDSSNNGGIEAVSVVAKVFNINNPTIAYTILRGNGASVNANFVSGSNVPMSVIINMDGDLTLNTDPAETISENDITIQPNTFNINIGATQQVTVLVSQIGTNTVPGTYNGNYIVEYGESTEFSKTGNIQVIVQNNAPVIAPIANQQMLVGQQFIYQVQATDVETSNSLVYSVTGVPGITIDPASGLITWVPGSIYSGTAVVSVSDNYTTSTEGFDIEAKIDMAQLTFLDDQIDLGGNTANRGDPVAATIQVENTGTRTITNLIATIYDSRGNTIDDEYNSVISVNRNTLAPGQEATVTVSLTIPENANSEPTKVAEVRVSGLDNGNTIEDEVNIYMEAESLLEIDDIDIEVNGKDEGDLNDGSSYRDLVEGDEVELTIKVKNLYNDDDDEISDVYIEITDDNWDIDEKSDEKDIEGDEDATFVVSFTIDEEVDDDETTILIRAYGEDNREDVSSFDHYDEWELRFEVDRKNDDIRIKDVSFNRNPVDCNANTVTMDVELKNYGTEDQKDIFIYAYSDKDNFNWNDKKTYIELDEGEETTRSFIIDLPNNLDEDTYIVNIEVKYDISKDADEEMVLIDVVCYNNQQDEEEDDDYTESDDSLIINTGDDDQGTTGGTIIPTGNVVFGQPKSDFEKFTDSTVYLMLLVVLVVGFLSIVIGWAGSILRK